MAGTTVCVSCAQLPMKDRTLAVKTSRCPECKAEVGMTSYGAAFRVQASTRRLFLSPVFITGATIGAGLFTFVVVLIALGFLSREQMVRPAKAPDLTAAEQLARVAEVAVDKPFPANIDKANGKAKIQQLIAQIREADQRDKTKPDAFLLARMNERSELRGMPFVMRTRAGSISHGRNPSRIPCKPSARGRNAICAVPKPMTINTPRSGMPTSAA
ncbi:MAG: hypothetical protein EXR98_17380 [Gemmataceae bacterium]|nr:hypothetical protein [Gemmataceae bacterium]